MKSYIGVCVKYDTEDTKKFLSCTTLRIFGTKFREFRRNFQNLPDFKRN